MPNIKRTQGKPKRIPIKRNLLDTKQHGIINDQPFVDENFRLWVLLHQASDAVLRARDKELSRHGVSTMQAAVLFIVRVLGNKAMPSEIARRLLRERHTVTGLLHRMEKNGLVEKFSDQNRRHVIRVGMTQDGQRVYQESLRRESINRIMSCLSNEEHQQMASLLMKIRTSALKEIGIERKLPFAND